MKKALICIVAASLIITSCRKDDVTDTTTQEVSDIATQNANDDAAIVKYMDEHYFDAQGNIKTFSSTDTSDDNFPKLSSVSVQKLSSGVVVVFREGAQPNPGTAIGATDVIRIMNKNMSYLSAKDNGTAYFASDMLFSSSIETSGVPEVDPRYYYVKNATMTASGKGRSYYEIEGFQEGLKYFKSFDQADSDGYNLQGAIIVPSRAAFARDEHYPYSFLSWRNRSFVFNFQVYKTSARLESQK